MGLLGVHCEHLLGILWCWCKDCSHLDVDVSLLAVLLQLLAEEHVELNPVVGVKELLIVDRLIIMSVFANKEEFPLIVLVEEQHLLAALHFSHYDADRVHKGLIVASLLDANHDDLVVGLGDDHVVLNEVPHEFAAILRVLIKKKF